MSLYKSPEVYICIPTYNAELTLRNTLESVLAQTYKNIKVLVVDNASEDKTLKIAEVFEKKDSRVQVFKSRENTGMFSNCTRCIELAKGDYTAIYHSDDMYEPTMVEEEVEFLERNKLAGAVFTMAVNIDRNGNKRKLYKLPYDLHEKYKKLYRFDEVFKAMLKYGSFLFCPSAMVRTDIYKKYIKVFDEKSFSASADADAWLRILKKYPIGIIDKPLLKYRASVNSFSYRLKIKDTEPHIMFKMFDAYIKDYAKDIINEDDVRNYEFLILKDNINRAFKFVMLGESRKAFHLLKKLFQFRTILYSLKSFVHAKVVFSGYAVCLLSLLPMNETLKTIVFRMRFK